MVEPVKKYVAISTNELDNYLFYLPIVTYGWHKLGWDVICFIVYKNTEKEHYVFTQLQKLNTLVSGIELCFVPVPEFKGYDEATIIQCARLYAANFIEPECYVLTSDVDMLPLSDHWRPNYDAVTTWGRDLTDYHYPICYVGMSGINWKKIMRLSGDTEVDMKKDLQSMPNSRSDDPVLRWVTDQDLLTARLNEHEKIIIPRGVDPLTHYPKGRVDRSAWELSSRQTERIDCHLPRPATDESNFYRVIALMKECFEMNVDEINFFIDYRKGYIKL